MCGSCYNKNWLLTNKQAADKRRERTKKYVKNGSAWKANWKNRLKKRFGLSEQEYYGIVDQQSGVCAICRRCPKEQKRKKKLCVDHDHKTNVRRGLLCDTCNRALGLFQDSIDLLKTAAEYLQKHADMQLERK